eukprot:TRINITY_DN8603_c0_g1_i1.p1 TRINITY_DN8603_c0_g1~~TRINITY_DN8603_c0_g1_i1.p1  ORF type:complete len:268 (-),score=39.00 TRINITY_DN8603_c0_g1_i1:153-956(-)
MVRSFYLSILILLGACILAVYSHGVRVQPTPLAPRLPNFLTQDWLIISNITLSPPFKSPPSGPNVLVGKGKTFFDWTIRSIVEVYYDYCIPIWPDFPQSQSNKFPCTFVNGPYAKSFVITGADRPKNWPGPCCLFGDPWYAPPPNFAQLYMSYYGYNTIDGKFTQVYWMQTGDVGGGPFYYEFYNNNATTPASFAFPGLPTTNNISTYIIQYFSDWTYEQPDPSVFEMPPECANNPPVCPSPGGIPVSDAPPHDGKDYCLFPGAPDE